MKQRLPLIPALLAAALAQAQAYGFVADTAPLTESEEAKATVHVWKEPKALGSQDLSFGRGSRERRPEPLIDETTGYAYYEFVDDEAKSPSEPLEECSSGFFPKINVKAKKGKWKMKFVRSDNNKLHSEVAANALAHGMGFLSREIYYVSAEALSDLPAVSGKDAIYVKGYRRPTTCPSKVGGELKQDPVHPEFWKLNAVTMTAKGMFDDDAIERGFRYNSPKLPKTREFTGLKLFQILIGNWDVHALDEVHYYNNELVSIPRKDEDGNLLRDAEGDRLFDQYYWQKDVGAAFGQLEPESIRPLQRLAWNFAGGLTLTRWQLGPYSRFRIVKKVDRERGLIHFRYSANVRSPIPLGNPRRISREEQAQFRQLPLADVRWFYETVLSRLTEAEIRSAFAGAHGTTEETEGFTRAFLKRIDEIRKAVE